MASWGSCDFSLLQKLRENLQKLEQADMQKFCEEVSRETAARLLALVIPRTPVGKKPRIAAKDATDRKALGGENAKKTYKVKGASGKSESFLSREGAILARYWAGYTGGTLRRGWIAKTEARSGGGGVSAGAAYAQSLEVVKTGEATRLRLATHCSMLAMWSLDTDKHQGGMFHSWASSSKKGGCRRNIC